MTTTPPQTPRPRSPDLRRPDPKSHVLDRVFPPEECDWERGAKYVSEGDAPVPCYPIFGITPEQYAQMQAQAHPL